MRDILKQLLGTSEAEVLDQAPLTSLWFDGSGFRV